MKGGKFQITLVSPATRSERANYKEELSEVCDSFEFWPVGERSALFTLTRMRYLSSPVPIPIRTDWNPQAVQLIAQLMNEADVVVFDFLHAAILAPADISKPTVLFTHNVEAEIFARHIEAASNPIFKWVWRNQYKKMFKFEKEATSRFDVVVAVSGRDGEKFARDYGLEDPYCIPTGVDLEFFSYQTPARFDDVVFCGSMDWLANQDAVDFFLTEVWPIVSEQRPQTRFTVIGRNPPAQMVEQVKKYNGKVSFTGFVDDVRDYTRQAGVSVIPIRVGGGTRLKVYEAMASGTPIVSTAIGVEGLPVEDAEHYLNADVPDLFAKKIIWLLDNPDESIKLSERARDLVEERFSYHKAAQVFEQACEVSMEKFRA